jgi:hypothetical protein
MARLFVGYDQGTDRDADSLPAGCQQFIFDCDDQHSIILLDRIKKIALRSMSSLRVGLKPTEAMYPKTAIIKRRR